ncbi:hypothetical protein [Arthrobacter monumenti]
MNGIDRLMAESNDRWSKAVRRAKGIADNGLGPALKTYFLQYFPIGFLVLVLLGSAGTAALTGLAWMDRLNLQFGLLLAVVGALVGGVVYNAKKIRPAADVGNVSVTLSLESHEQKHVRRQVLGKEPVEAEHLQITRAAAVQQRKNVATQLLIQPMIPLGFIPQMLSGSSTVLWLGIFLILCYVGALTLMLREFWLAGRFLMRTDG